MDDELLALPADEGHYLSALSDGLLLPGFDTRLSPFSVLVKNLLNRSISLDIVLLLNELNVSCLHLRAILSGQVRSRRRHLVHMLSSGIAQAAIVCCLSAECALLSLYEDLPRASAQIWTMLDLCDLLIVLLFLSDFPLLLDGLNEPHLVLHELLETSPLLDFTGLPGFKFGREDTALYLLLLFLFSQLSNLLFLFQQEIFHFVVELILTASTVNEDINRL